MKARRSTSRSMLIAVLVVSMLLCQVGTASLVGPGSPEGAAAQIEFTPHVATLVVTGAPPVTAVSTLGPMPTMTAMVGPGRALAPGDDLPPVAGEELLDEPFGCAELVGRPGEYLVWSTDNKGNRRYYVITEDNRYFEEIKRISDAREEAKTELLAQKPASKLALGFLGALGSAAAAGICGLGAITTGSRGTTAWLGGPFGKCVAAASTATAASIGYAMNGATAYDGYNARVEELRKQIERSFAQLPFVVSP